MVREEYGYGFLTIRMLSPWNRASEDGCVGVFKGYYDGSIGDGCVVLASYVASEPDWGELEIEWAKILERHDIPGIHMRDLLSRNEPRAFAGKTMDEAVKAVDDAVSYLAALSEWRFRRYSCVINREDYARAQAALVRLAGREPEAICVNHCAGRLFSPRFVLEGHKPWKGLSLLFDQSEPFIRHIMLVWNNNQPSVNGAARRRPQWTRYVAHIGSVNNKDNECIAMQAADVLAWVARRHHTHHDRESWYDALCGGKQTQLNSHDFYDYDALVAKYGEA